MMPGTQGGEISEALDDAGVDTLSRGRYDDKGEKRRLGLDAMRSSDDEVRRDDEVRKAVTRMRHDDEWR